MRATGHLFLVALTGTMGSLMAYTPPGPGEIEAVGEFLYLLPSTDNSYFVIDADASNTLPVGQRENNDFDFAPGFRIGAAYGFCNCNRNVQAYFSRIDTTQNKTLTGDFLWATTGNPDLASAFENYGGSANSHRNLLYERGDFLFAQQIVNCCGLKISPQIGLELAYLRLEENTTYQSTTALGTLAQNSKAWGIGPQLGFELSYSLCEWNCGYPATLALNALASGSLLASRTHASFETVLNGVAQVDVQDESTWRVIPSLNARIGLNYDICFPRVTTSLAIGYQFSSYLRALTRTTFTDDVADSLSSSEYCNIDLQGLYISAAIGF